MLKFEEERDVTPVRDGDRVVELVPGPIRSYFRLGPLRLRVPGWAYGWALELAS